MSTTLPPPAASTSARSVALPVVVLLVLLAATTTAAVSFGVLYFTRGAAALGPAGGSTPGGAAVQTGADGLLVQTGAVQPRTRTFGVVFYPLPYATPPNLKLSARRCEVVRQDETGFIWATTREVERIVAQTRNLGADLANLDWAQVPVIKPDKPEDLAEDFTWEASGARAAEGAIPKQLSEQTGKFQSVIGLQGEVRFPFPYALPPNVALSGSGGETTVVVECTTTGFKWKNGGNPVKPGPWDQGSVTWTAKGIKATTVPK